MAQSLRKQRKSGIELLRIIAAMGVIVLHYNYNGSGGALEYAGLSSNNTILIYTLETIFVSSVNVFVLINGYFDVKSNKRDLLKPLKLIIEVIIFNVLYYLVSVVLGYSQLSLSHLARVLFPTNWFVIIYCGLYLVSPFINVVLSNLTQKEYKILICIIFVLFSIYPMAIDILEGILGQKIYGLYTISSDGSASGYSIVNFILLYIIGAYLRTYRNSQRENQGSGLKRIIIWAILVLINTVWSIAFAKLGYSNGNSWEYCNPLLILQAVLVFEIFRNIKMKSIVINNIAKASFCVYIIHGYLIGRVGIEKVISFNNPLLTICHIFIVALLIYFAGIIINFVYNFVMNPVFQLIEKHWNKYRVFHIGA